MISFEQTNVKDGMQLALVRKNQSVGLLGNLFGDSKWTNESWKQLRTGMAWQQLLERCFRQTIGGQQNQIIGLELRSIGAT